MRNSRKKQVKILKKKRRTILITLWVLIFISMTLTMIFGENGFLKYLKLKDVKANRQMEINNMSKDNNEIKVQIDAIKEAKDRGLIEELAREHGLMKEDEIIFQFKSSQ